MRRRNMSSMEAAIRAPMDPTIDLQTGDTIDPNEMNWKLPNGDMPIVEATSIAEKGLDYREYVRMLGRPIVVIERQQRPAGPDETSFGMSKATYITGYDREGNEVTTRGFYERRSRVGKKWQATMEKWKIKRVRRTLARSAMTLEHSELRVNGL